MLVFYLFGSLDSVCVNSSNSFESQYFNLSHFQISDVAIDSVKTGMGGATGNKGTVAIRYWPNLTSNFFNSDITLRGS